MSLQTSPILASFVVNRAPLSYNAGRPQKYLSHIASEFNKHNFQGSPFSGYLYIRVYYFHITPDSRDADNFSKRVVDALRGIAYQDDSIVILRSAAKIHLPQHPTVDLTQMREPALTAFLDAHSREQPILYIEIGHFSMPLLTIGGK